jgi:radical SAM superfamily enzyme YgiQ (UPF0313 family)
MNHILLVNIPYSYDFAGTAPEEKLKETYKIPADSKTFASTRMEENLGLLYIEASLKGAGYSCSIIDGLVYDLSYETLIKEIQKNLPEIFTGFLVHGKNIINTLHIVKELRKEGYKGHINMSGIWAGFKYREILKEVKEIDSVCVGEGEEVALKLAENLSKGMSLRNIDGLATRNKDGTINFTPGKSRDALDALPVPDRIGYYLEVIKREKYVPIVFSRGCNERCTFCNIVSYNKIFNGKAWRHRSPKAVVDEMEYIIKTTGVRNFLFVDDNFFGTGKKEKYLLLAEEIIKRKSEIKFSLTCHVEDIDYKLLHKLKKGGLTEVTLGIESWVESQIKRYNKKLTLKEIWKAIEILDRLKLYHTCFIIPIDPYVTREEIIKNLDRIEKHRPSDHTVIYNQFFKKIRLDPYLPLFRKCLKDKLIENFQPEKLDNYDIKYRQFHPDVQGIADAAEAIEEIYSTCNIKLNITGKTFPVHQWDRIKKDILQAFKKLLYKYFREYIDTGDTEKGKDFFYKKMNKTFENIRSFAEELKREDIIELKEYIIDIDGTKISTRPAGFNELVSIITKKSKNG